MHKRKMHKRKMRKLITAKKTCERLGGVSDMSLWRWLNNPELEFPRPVYIGNRRYFDEDSIDDWVERQAAKSAA